MMQSPLPAREMSAAAVGAAGWGGFLVSAENSPAGPGYGMMTLLLLGPEFGLVGVPWGHRRGIPNLDHAVDGTAGEPMTLGTKGDACYGAFMSLEGQQLLAGNDVPHFDGAISR